MENENPILTLGDYSKPRHEGYRNTIELPVGNNVVPLRSDTIRLVQNGCSFYGLRFEDPNQHLKDFLKLVDSLDLDVANRERTRMRLQNSAMTSRCSNNILMFQKHQGESLSEAWTYFKDLLQKVPHHGIDLWLQDLTLYENESWNDPKDFAKPVKAMYLPQDVTGTSDCRLNELKNQVQCLMEAHLAPKQPIHVNKISFSCEICNGPHDTQYCMKNPEQAFVDYASSRTNEAGDKWFTFKTEQNHIGDTYNPPWKSHPNLRDVEVHIGRLKLLNDFYVIDMKKDLKTPLLVGRGFLATANVVIDCRKSRIAVGEGITSSDGIGAQTPYYVRKEFMNYHLPKEWEIARDAEINPFKDVLMFRRMVEFLGALPINLEGNM
ncbi:MAK10-like protein [Tanacetum coccineum]